MITIFQNIHKTNEPKHIKMGTALARIKDGASKELIDKIRVVKDKKERNALKLQLPCILYSGLFRTRNIDGMESHSGFISMDFDHLDDIESRADKLTELMMDECIYAVWLSPSGNGVKALMKTAATNAEDHYEYWAAIYDKYPDMDKACKDPSRVTYESFDPTITINEKANTWTKKKVKEEIKPKVNSMFGNAPIHATATDYSIIQRAVDMIANSVEGEKHTELVKAANLMGGFIAGGQVEHSVGQQALWNEISKREIDNEKKTMNTINDGIANGMRTPLYPDEGLPKKGFVDKRQPVKEVPIEDMILPESAGYDRLNKMIRGELDMGLEVGMSKLDTHLRFKENQYLLVVGKQNVGKTFTMLWYMYMLATKHGKKFMIFSMENPIDSIKRFLLQFYLEKEYHEFGELKETDEARKWMHKHFRFMSTTARYSFTDIIHAAEKYYEMWEYDSIFIDPYNALEIKLKQVGLTSTYDYHMEAANVFQFFAINTTGIILNCHVVSMAQREKERPSLDQVQGGTAFTNKAHDGIVVHRDLYDREKMTITEISVEKVKDTQTGGLWTGKDPIELRIKRGMCGFLEVGSVDEKIQQGQYNEERNATMEEVVDSAAKGNLIPMKEAEQREALMFNEDDLKADDSPAPF